MLLGILGIVAATPGYISYGDMAKQTGLSRSASGTPKSTSKAADAALIAWVEANTTMEVESRVTREFSWLELAPQKGNRQWAGCTGFCLTPPVAPNAGFCGLAFGPPKTRSGARSVPLDTMTVDALRDHRRQQDLNREAWDDAWVDLGLVFTRENGDWIRPDYLTQRFVRLAAKVGLPRIRLHDLRHSSRLHHIGIGRRHADTDVLVLVHDLHIRVLNHHGELLRELQLNPTKDYQPQA